MSAPTLWQEGHWSGDRVIRLSISLCLVAVLADTVLVGQLDWVFDIAFVAICIGAALAVRPGDFFAVGVLPPLLLLGCAILLSIVARDTVATANDGFVQGVVSALAGHSGGLAAGYLSSLSVLAIRQRVVSRAGLHAGADHSKRAGSPAP